MPWVGINLLLARTSYFLDYSYNGPEDTWFCLEEGDGGYISSLEKGGQWEGLARHTDPDRASQGPEGLCLCGIYCKPCIPCLSFLLVVDMGEV